MSGDTFEIDMECWSCGIITEVITRVTSPGFPSEGDYNICFSCGALGIFTGDGWDVRAPTEEERAEALKQPSVRRTLGAALTHIALKEGS